MTAMSKFQAARKPFRNCYSKVITYSATISISSVVNSLLKLGITVIPLTIIPCTP